MNTVVPLPKNNIFVKIIYDTGKTMVVQSATIHPYLLQEIRLNGFADFMFSDGTFCTLVIHQ